MWPLAKSFPVGSRGVVAAKHPLAAEVGVGVLRDGGTAIDAAVATSLASGVVEPHGSGVGGGGLALHATRDGVVRTVAFGMVAPASAQPDMYEIVPDAKPSTLFGWPATVGDAHVSGPHSIAVPGQVAGLHRLWEQGGRLPWERLVAPAAQLAADGFPTDWLTSLFILRAQDLLSRFPATRATFLPRGRAPAIEGQEPAEIVRQSELAGSLQAIAHDPCAMQSGAIAASIEAATVGRVTTADLAAGTPVEAAPLSIALDARGTDSVTTSIEVHLIPGATGGATTLEWLGILQALDPPRDEHDPRLWWAIVRAGEAAFHDRLARLGDPRFVPFPDEILDAGYHRRLADAIARGETVPSARPASIGSTSHLAVVDADGNAVSVTQTLLSGFGSGVVAPGSGVLLNNGMMWFDPVPGRLNSIAPGKLPLANMCPVLVTRGGRPWLAYGASGGRRIMPAIVQILVRVAWLGQSLADAIAAPRIDISTDTIIADERFEPALVDALADALGEPVQVRGTDLGNAPWASPVGLMCTDDGAWTGGGDLYTQACVLAA